MQTATPISIIVAEKGSRWAPWAERCRRDGAESVVVVQHDDETTAEFALRVRARVVQMEQEGRSPTSGVLVGGGRVDHDAVSARSLIIRAIATEMAHHEGGTFFLDDAGDDRFAMAALASTVQMLVHGTGVSILHAGSDIPVAA